MPRANNNGIEIEYDTIGDPSDEPLLLVMGFTAQLIAWDDKLCQALADKGYFVIRYDNRDCGLSTHLDGATFDMAELFNAMMAGGEAPAVPYTLSDMAGDGIAVLDGRADASASRGSRAGDRGIRRGFEDLQQPAVLRRGGRSTARGCVLRPRLLSRRRRSPDGCHRRER